MEIKNKLTVTRANRGKKEKGHQGTCIKDLWTKTMGGRAPRRGLNVGGGGVEEGTVIGGEWEQQ